MRLFMTFLVISVIISCSDSKEELTNLEDSVTGICNDTRLTDSNFDGTICCTQRNSDLSFSSTIEYEYFTNLSNPKVSWQVNTGDIEILSGENSNVVSIRLGEGFTEGELYVLGSSGDNSILMCGHPILISRNQIQ